MLKGRKIKFVMALLVSFGLFGCGGDEGSVSIGGGGNSLADEDPSTQTAVVFSNQYYAPLSLKLYYSYGPALSNIVGEDADVGYMSKSKTTQLTEEFWKEVDSRDVTFTAVDSNSLGTIGQAGSIYGLTSGRLNRIYAYGHAIAPRGLRMAHISNLPSRPSNDRFNIRLLNTYSTPSFEGPVDFYMTKSDGGALELVASNIETGKISPVINAVAHPLGNRFAILAAGSDYPAQPDDEKSWLFYNDSSDGIAINGGNNYIMRPVYIPASTDVAEYNLLFPELEFTIELK
ncbi:hypothetical protein [Agarivorans sp. 1_MG-2023]|uniref:hypothetical protein n=1 Tax=Agarivorans sp. 1_MG-2023 TaxID=3062634 RepID=UPI0026E27611|nr:hypothetical protein [Agarivorans sp. 1_MG-2023]MDO6763524.1 hypothetical protein [Agarivorans sp. 1_MG-2023]